MKDNLLVKFAHAIAPRGASTRAVVDRTSGETRVFVEGGPTPDGAVVVARVGRRYVVGAIKRSAPGWVEIDGTAYPSDAVEVRGPVLFIARPVEATDGR